MELQLAYQPETPLASPTEDSLLVWAVTPFWETSCAYAWQLHSLRSSRGPSVLGPSDYKERKTVEGTGLVMMPVTSTQVPWLWEPHRLQRCLGPQKVREEKSGREPSTLCLSPWGHTHTGDIPRGWDTQARLSPTSPPDITWIVMNYSSHTQKSMIFDITAREERQRGDFVSHSISYRHYAAYQVTLMVRNLPVNAGDTRDAGSIPGLRRVLEKEMATHSRILAWRIPWTEKPGGLQSMGPQKVRHDWLST